MNGLKCSQCGAPFKSVSQSKCKQCGHPSMPIDLALYKKAKPNTEPEDVFKNELSPESIFSKFAMVSFFSFVVSLGMFETQTITMVSLAGFLMFSALYGYFRFRNSV